MKRYIIVVFISLLSQALYCQQVENEDEIYGFCKEVILKDPDFTGRLSADASSRMFMKDNRDTLDLDMNRLRRTVDIKNYNNKFWDTILNTADIQYMMKQVRALKNFKWKQDKLPADVKVYTMEFKEDIVYSAPIFNVKHNFALVDYYTFSGRLSSYEEILIYVKQKGKWLLIGKYLKFVS